MSNLSNALLNDIWGDSAAGPMIQLARTLGTNSAIYLVGGKVYRTLVKITYGYDPGSYDCDWDFLIEHIETDALIAHPRVWKRVPGSYYGTNSVNYLHVPTNRKVDFISMRDIKNQLDEYQAEQLLKDPDWDPYINGYTYAAGLPKLDHYFQAVPLSIQAMAINLHSDKVKYTEEAMDNVKKQALTWNNKGMLAKKHRPQQYIEEKANSLLFSAHGTKHTCTCLTSTILTRGCICGGI